MAVASRAMHATPTPRNADGAYLVRDHDPALRGHEVRCKLPIREATEHAATLKANTAAA